MANKSKATAYKNNFNAEKYDRVGLMIRKGTKIALQEAAIGSGESINGYIKNAIQARYKAETGKDIEL